MRSAIERRAFRPVRGGLAAVLALAFVAAPPSARALQESPTAGPAAGIGAGSLVRIRTMARGRFEGPLLGGDHESVTLGLEDRPATFGAAELDALWTSGHAVGTGAWVGALAGGVPTTLFAALLCDAFSEGAGCRDWDKVALLGLIGGGAGAGIGALIGAFVRTWDLRWSRVPGDPGLGTPPGISGIGISIRL